MLFDSRRRVITVLLCIGLTALTAGCPGDKPPDENKSKSAATPSKFGGVYRRPLWDEPSTLDPAFATDVYTVSVLQQLFDGLVQFDADLNAIPALARAWNASRDGLIWTFELRQGVTFHNGREFTADDVVYAFTRLLDPNLRSPFAWLFERVRGASAYQAGTAKQVQGFRVVAPYTLEIRLTEPYAAFVSMLGIVPAKVVPREEVERLGAQFGKRPVGTGPFRFVEWKPGKTIVLHANQTYFEGRPFLNRVQYQIFPAYNLQASLTAFEAGHLEDTLIAAAERQRLIQTTRYRFMRKPILGTLLLWMNTRHAPLNHPKVRQAINHAINRQAMISTIRKHRFVQAQGVLPPGMPGYDPELVGYTYDPQRARQLLAEAGHPEGKGLPKLQLWSSVVSPEARAEHEAIQRDLQRIGITVELHTAESWKHYETEILGRLPRAMYRYAWYADFPDPDNFLFVLFHSQSANNFAHYVNPEVDRLLAQAQRETHYLKRLQVYRQAEKRIVADAPTVNLLYYTFEHLFQPYVRGIELNALGEPYIPMKKIWLDTTHHAYVTSRTSD